MRVIHKQNQKHTYLRHKHFKIKLTLGTYILFGLFLGVAAGLILGPKAAFLSQIGKILIDLIMMGVLPFIVVSLLCGLGTIKAESLLRLLLSFGLSSLAMWVSFFIIAVALYSIFPSIDQHSLYAFSKGAQQSFADQFIPTNPFNSLANSYVPAVVVFFTCLGIAIIGVKEKKAFLETMKTMLYGLLKLNSFMVNLVPFIVFAFTAHMVGNSTITASKLVEFQVFLIPAFLGCFIAFFFIIPLLVVTFTDIGYLEFLHEFKHIVITALLTQNTLIMIPLLIDKINELSKKHKITGESNEAVVNTSITVGFNITGPSMIPAVVFILFCAWFIGQDVSTNLPGLFLYSVSTLFGGQTFSIVALLDYLHLPPDMIGIYMMFSNLYLQNTIAAVKQPFLASLAIICVFANANRISFRILPFIKTGLIGLIISAIALIGLGIYFKDTVKSDPHAFTTLIDKMALNSPVPVILETKTPTPSIGTRHNSISEIVKKKEIVFAYRKAFEPFTFLNSKGELIGFITALAERLAASMECSVRFVPVEDIATAIALLNSGDIDMGFYEFNIDDIDNLIDVGYSDPILYLHSGLIVKNERRKDFQSWDDIINDSSVVIGVSSLFPMNHILSQQIAKSNKAKIIKVDGFTLKDVRDVKYDAYFTSAERGLFFCLEYPKYSFVMPEGLSSINENTLIFIVNSKNMGFLYYINYWLKIQEESKEISKLYSYWVEGKIDSSD